VKRFTLKGGYRRGFEFSFLKPKPHPSPLLQERGKKGEGKWA